MSEIDEIFAKKKTSCPSSAEPKPKKKAKQPNPSDDGRFRDSRGTTHRHKTEEGYTIYREDELGISNEGGDTPLCPFDCNCCF